MWLSFWGWGGGTVHNNTVNSFTGQCIVLYFQSLMSMYRKITSSTREPKRGICNRMSSIPVLTLICVVK